MIHIDLDWEERDVIAVISLLGLLIAETGKDKDSLSKLSELAMTAHLMADEFQKFDVRYKRQQFLWRRLLRDEITAEEYKETIAREERENREMDAHNYSLAQGGDA